MLLPLLAALTCGLAVVCIVLALAERRSGAEALRASLARTRGGSGAPAAAPEVLRQEHFSTVGLLNALLSRRDWSHRTAVALEQAGLHLSVGTFTLIRVVLIAASVVGTILLTGVPLLALPAALIVALLPSGYLARARTRRARCLEQQLPEVLTLLSNAVQSGFGLMQALRYISEQVEEPLGGELRRLLRDVAVGTTVEEAFTKLAVRNPSESLGIVTTAIIIQRSAGGNLAEILDTVADTIRDRDRIQGEIRTLTTQQMYTGYLLALLPVGIAVVISLMSPGYMEPLFATPLGKALVAGAVAMDVLGFLIIRRILAIEV